MTLADQLRAVADRIEAAEQDLLVAQADLWRLAGALPGEVVDLANDPSLLLRDGSSIQTPDLAPAERDGAGQQTPASSSAPIEQVGPADPRAAPAAEGRQPSVSPAPPGLHQCPDCSRGRIHGTKRERSQAKPLAIAPHDDPTEPDAHHFAAERSNGEDRRPSGIRRPTIAERVAARDASRAAHDKRRSGRHVGGGLRGMNAMRGAA